MKKDSIKLIILICSLSFLVIRPIVPKTDILIRAKQQPVTAKSNFTAIKVLTIGRAKQVKVMSAKAISIDFLYPILLIKEARVNEATAILMSLKASSMAAEDSNTPK